MALHIKVTSPTKPGVVNAVGGTIAITGTAPNWEIKSADIITVFEMGANKADITKVEIISEDLTALQSGALSGTFSGLTNMTEFVAPSTAFGKVTDFMYAWKDCSSLTSFPIIDTSSGTTFHLTWRGCSSLTSFPVLDVSQGTIFSYAWSKCSSLTSFPVLNTSKAIEFHSAWFGCSGLTSFPILDSSSVTIFHAAWRNCTSLTAFPALDTSKGNDFSYAWNGCTKLKCIQRINTTLATNTNLMFDGTTLCRPNAEEQVTIAKIPGIDWVSDVPAGEDCCTYVPPVTPKLGDNIIGKCYLGDKGVGAYLGDRELCKAPLPEYTFHAIVRSAVKPSPSTKRGGTVNITNNGDGTWEITSEDPLSYLRWNRNRDITEFAVIKSTTITDFGYSWYGCSNLISFDASGLTSGTIFREAWDGCSSLTSFDASGMTSGTRFGGTWSRCAKLECITSFKAPNCTDVGSAFSGCGALVHPNAAEQAAYFTDTGIDWTNPAPCP